MGRLYSYQERKDQKTEKNQKLQNKKKVWEILELAWKAQEAVKQEADFL